MDQAEDRRDDHSQRGEQQKADLNESIFAVEGSSEDILALDEALTRLAQEEPVTAELVKLRYFVGLTLEQAAELIGISRRTATRHWTFARAWLYKQIAKGDSRYS